MTYKIFFLYQIDFFSQYNIIDPYMNPAQIFSSFFRMVIILPRSWMMNKMAFLKIRQIGNTRLSITHISFSFLPFFISTYAIRVCTRLVLYTTYTIVSLLRLIPRDSVEHARKKGRNKGLGGTRDSVKIKEVSKVEKIQLLQVVHTSR